VLAAVAFGVGFVLFHGGKPLVMLGGLLMGALTVFMHRVNIVRLLKGQEKKTHLFRANKNL
jgi:glycerol-3-phosphate acyltransferase PlsY